jgi:CheY-like chemotaxis protein
VVVELIRLIPTVLWVLFIAILIGVFYKPIKHELLPRMSGFTAFGVAVTFIREELDRAIENQKANVSEGDRSQVLRRAQKVAPLLREAQILWVDDHPEYNDYERRVLRSFGISIDLARATKEALRMLRQKNYDAVISDMERDGADDEGQRFVKEMLDEGLYRWTTFYAAAFDPSRGTPAYAHGMTNRPDHLLHNVMDILERERS